MGMMQEVAPRAGAGLAADEVASDTTGAPPAARPPLVTVSDGERFDLRVAPVIRRVGGTAVRMLAYNGSIPGPVLRVRQGSEIVVGLTNDGDADATVHWHGVRLENRSGKDPFPAQRPVPVGESLTYRVRFPDAGLYWYHPHLRQEGTGHMGLYGSIVVDPRDPGYWPPADREEVVTVDEVALVNGPNGWALAVGRGEVVRFYLTNATSTRLADLRIPGAVMKLIGGDSGRCERETLVERVVLAPAERAVIDVLFDQSGLHLLEQHHPDLTRALGRIDVVGTAMLSSAAAFPHLRRSPELRAERLRLGADLVREPDQVLALAEGTGDLGWVLVDRLTGKRDGEIDWPLRSGDRVKIRLVGELDPGHPGQQPFHVHGAGRFLVISRDGRPEPNLVWKDTVPVAAGEVVDIVLDVSDPGLGTARHIAGHAGSGAVPRFLVAS